MKTLHTALIAVAVLGAGYVGYAAYEASSIKPGDRVTVNLKDLQAPEVAALNGILRTLGLASTATIDATVTLVEGDNVMAKIANLTGREGHSPELAILPAIQFKKSAITQKVTT